MRWTETCNNFARLFINFSQDTFYSCLSRVLVSSRSASSFVRDSRCVFGAKEVSEDKTLGRGITGVDGEGRYSGEGPLLEVACLLRPAGSYSSGTSWSPAISCHELRFHSRILPLTMDIFSVCTFRRFSLLTRALSLALVSRGHSVSTRGTPLRAREWRLSRLARPFQRASAIPSFLPACLPACLLAYLPLPTPHHPLFPLSFSFSCAYPNMFACLPRADDCRHACARCHPDCLIVSWT